MFQLDQQSVQSDVTDLTDNTHNKQYHNDDADSLASGNLLISSSSVASIKETDIEEILDAGLTVEEVERNIQLSTAHKKLKIQQKADMLLAVALKKRRPQAQQSINESINNDTDTILTANAGNQEKNDKNNGDKSNSNCDAVDGP